MLNNKDFKHRSALRSRAEGAAQRYADEHGESTVIYEVNGGYEARREAAPAPLATHRKLVTLQPTAPVQQNGHEAEPPKSRKKDARK